MSSKDKTQKSEIYRAKPNPIVNTENEFAAEFGEGLYGGQAREAFKQHQANKNNNESSK